jgi:import receptor subunit TOM70
LDPNYTKALLRRAKAFEQVEEYQMAFEDLTMLCILENFQNAKSMQYAEKLVAILGERMFKEEINVCFLTFLVFSLQNSLLFVLET